MSASSSLSELHIQFLAIGSPQEKGRALESVTGAVWARLGYRGLDFNVHTTGEEIDVIGKHIVSGDTLKGQCKAHAERISTPALKSFHSDVVKQREQNGRLTGIFISLSGYAGTVKRWYDELCDQTKQWFRLQDGAQFLVHLQESGMIVHRDLLQHKWSNYTRLEVSSLCLVVSERGPFWMVGLADTTRADAFYFLADGHGEPPREDEIEYLTERLDNPLHGARMTRLRGREEVTTALLRLIKYHISARAS